jgi:hypothetical protein
LGHVISEQGVSTDPSKIEAIKSWPHPENVKHLMSFLGLAGYYRKFIRNLGIICRPLTDLLKKNCVFMWTEVHHKAFETLKVALVETPVLALPDFFKAIPTRNRCK